MSVVINEVEKGSPAYKAGIREADILISINGNEIVDVLDYRFYQNESRLTVTVENKKGKEKTYKIKKKEYEELGLVFDSYLMDTQHSCKNNCIFCFIDQLPKGLRETLYFKDDDSRLSFLFGNYITLTNLTEHEISRIIKMHISPVNISVHTTNPELRCKMMNNRFAGEALSVIKRFDDAGIKMNFQLVLVPGYNDKDELKRSLYDLSEYKNALCIASVPVGITKFREGLCKIEPFDKQSATEVIEITESIAEEIQKKRGERIIFAADEFYLKAEKPIPCADYYGEFNQLDNGVGMWALFKSDVEQALSHFNEPSKKRSVCCVTGKAAYPLIKWAVDSAMLKWHNLDIRAYEIKNNFFGEKITVAGLVTGRDIIEQLKDKELFDEIIIPSNMLRFERDLFLDGTSVEDVEKALGVKVRISEIGGWDFIESLVGETEEG